MIRRPLICWLIGTLAVGAALAQCARGERLPVKIFTSADGLGSSFVNAVMRESRGFLWFCTRDGLSRYDGSRFITYQLGDKDPPSGIEAIYETRNGDYWVSTTAGTYRFHANVVAHPTQAGPNGRPVLPVEFIWTGRGVIFEDSHGQLWSGGWALYRIREQNGVFSMDEAPLDLGFTGQGSLVNQIEEAKDGTVLVSAGDYYLHHFVAGRLVSERPGIPATSIARWSSRHAMVDHAGPAGLTCFPPAWVVTGRGK
jgi:ligand-binding sensor domain-containing protein